MAAGHLLALEEVARHFVGDRLALRLLPLGRRVLGVGQYVLARAFELGGEEAMLLDALDLAEQHGE